MATPRDDHIFCDAANPLPLSLYFNDFSLISPFFLFINPISKNVYVSKKKTNSMPIYPNTNQKKTATSPSTPAP